MPKLYETLGVKASAAKADIKKAYHKLAKKHHPDKGGDEDMFKEIQTAYDVLGDSERRARYDQTCDTERVKPGPESILMVIFSALIEGGDFHGNIIDRIIEKVNDEIDKMQKARRELKARIDDLTALKGRISADGENLFEMVLDGTITQLTDALESAQAKVMEAVEMKKALQNYSDDKPDLEEREPDIAELLKAAGYGTLGGQSPFMGGQGPFRP